MVLLFDSFGLAWLVCLFALLVVLDSCVLGLVVVRLLCVVVAL